MMHLIQAYLDKLYSFFYQAILNSIASTGEGVYGELYHESVSELLKRLRLNQEDHFFDLGSGLGRVVFQVFLESKVMGATGIEIDPRRFIISSHIQKIIERQLTRVFQEGRVLKFVQGDFLNYHFHQPSVIYLCSTAFSFDFLKRIGKKINQANTVYKVASLRKLPDLHHFELKDRIFLHATWGRSPCFIYERNKIYV